MGDLVRGVLILETKPVLILSLSCGVAGTWEITSVVREIFMGQISLSRFSNLWRKGRRILTPLLWVTYSCITRSTSWIPPLSPENMKLGNKEISTEAIQIMLLYTQQQRKIYLVAKRTQIPLGSSTNTFFNLCSYLPIMTSSSKDIHSVLILIKMKRCAQGKA